MFPYTHWGVGNPAAPRGPNPNVRPKWWIMWWNANHVTPKKLNYEKKFTMTPHCLFSLLLFSKWDQIHLNRALWFLPSTQKTLVPKYLLPILTWKLTFFVQNMKWYYNLGKTQFRSKTADFTWFHDFHRIFQWIDIPILTPYNFANDFHNFVQWALG